MNLNIQNINKENFSQFGQLISINDVMSENINSDTTKSFYDLVDIEILGEKPKVSVASKMLALLLTISPGLGEE